MDLILYGIILAAAVIGSAFGSWLGARSFRERQLYQAHQLATLREILMQTEAKAEELSQTLERVERRSNQAEEQSHRREHREDRTREREEQRERAERLETRKPFASFDDFTLALDLIGQWQHRVVDQDRRHQKLRRRVTRLERGSVEPSRTHRVLDLEAWATSQLHWCIDQIEQINRRCERLDTDFRAYSGTQSAWIDDVNCRLSQVVSFDAFGQRCNQIEGDATRYAIEMRNGARADYNELKRRIEALEGNPAASTEPAQ